NHRYSLLIRHHYVKHLLGKCLMVSNNFFQEVNLFRNFKMRLTYKFRYYPQYPHSDQLRQLCYTSKSLYNKANYLIKKELQQTKKWLRYLELNQQLKATSIHYRLLKAQTAQQILKVVDKNWSSYFKVIKDW
ncbi:MAG: hypothetical protein ACFFAJ_16160, partial [Candidatus Hodarchaeota archaeon]